MHYLALLGVDLNLLDLLTAMGVVSLSDLRGWLDDEGVEGEEVADSSVIVWSPRRAIECARVFWEAAGDRCGFTWACCFCGGEKTNAGTDAEGAETIAIKTPS